jgi:hypothetical protein
MPEEATIEYHRNLKRIETDVLRRVESAAIHALERRLIFGRSRWIAKVDSKNRTFYVLERVHRPGEMLTYCVFDEIGRLDSDTLHDHLMGKRTRYDESLTERPLLFEELSPDQCAAIANGYLDSTVIVPKHVARVESLSGFSRSAAMPTHVEIQPTPVALTDEGAAQIPVGSGSAAAWTWHKLFLMVYRSGGRVFFRERNAADLEAVIGFQ